MDPIEEKIIEFFEHNYRHLQLEGGHALTVDIKNLALQQVLMYWRKLKDVAEKITDSEVRLSLPNQKTSKGRPFSIEGVVDIVREGSITHMYDVKTHDLEYIKSNQELYEEQLNVYAHVWQELRKNKLDLTAIISTSLPKSLSSAWKTGDQTLMEKALNEWDPVLPLNIDPEKVKKTIKEFGDVIDSIEDGEFEPVPVERLSEKCGAKNERFGRTVCQQNCDARFSCSTFRKYAKTSAKGKEWEFLKYFETSSVSHEDKDNWLAANSEFEILEIDD